MEGEEPVSPMSRYFTTSVLPAVSILVVFETNVPIDDSFVWTLLEKEFLLINPRFSSIMVTDEQGRPKWKKVKVRLEDHVRIPTFAGNLKEFYDEELQDYLSQLTTERLPQSRPLWEIHLIKYPTRGAAGSMVLKLHHALGDGFSLMGALFSFAKRADDPSLPFTFPSSSSRGKRPPTNSSGLLGVLAGVRRGLLVLFNTAGDVPRSLLGSSLLADDRTPLRPRRVGVELLPLTISSITIPLSDIREVKARLKGTVTAVIVGTIFYGIHLFLQREGQDASKARMTALVLANTRAVKSYQTAEEMARPGGKGPWGNHFGFMHVPIPKCKDVAATDPVEFVLQARKTINKGRNSLSIYLTGKLLQAITRLRGPEAAARYIVATGRGTSLAISNVVGPGEPMTIADHPATSVYFMTSGVPHSLNTTVISYAGKVRVAVGAEKGSINSHLFVACLEEAFRRIFEAAVGKIDKNVSTANLKGCSDV